MITLIIKMAKALDDQYTSEGLRLASFLDKWPKDEIMSPVDLVRAGLFYCGPGDRVKCAFCGGIMYNWVTGDIPLKEHLKHFPFCKFAKVRATEILNQDYTNMTQCSVHKSAERIVRQLGFSDKLIRDGLQKLKGNTITTVDLLDAIFEIEDEQVIQENKRLDTAPACKICMDGDITMVLLPCRHLLCCERCAEQLQKCPWCRSTILGTLKTFFTV